MSGGRTTFVTMTEHAQATVHGPADLRSVEVARAVLQFVCREVADRLAEALAAAYRPEVP